MMGGLHMQWFSCYLVCLFLLPLYKAQWRNSLSSTRPSWADAKTYSLTRTNIMQNPEKGCGAPNSRMLGWQPTNALDRASSMQRVFS